VSLAKNMISWPFILPLHGDYVRALYPWSCDEAVPFDGPYPRRSLQPEDRPRLVLRLRMAYHHTPKQL
jgi:hypothetical protein